MLKQEQIHFSKQKILLLIVKLFIRAVQVVRDPKTHMYFTRKKRSCFLKAR